MHIPAMRKVATLAAQPHLVSGGGQLGLGCVAVQGPVANVHRQASLIHSAAHAIRDALHQAQTFFAVKQPPGQIIFLTKADQEIGLQHHLQSEQ
jgi:hypothetical protein